MLPIAPVPLLDLDEEIVAAEDIGVARREAQVDTVGAESPDITSEYLRPLTGPVGKVLSDDMQFCFSLKVAAGECVAVIGPSGAGKSTLLALIGGIVRPVGAANRLGSVRGEPSGRRSSARSRGAK